MEYTTLYNYMEGITQRSYHGIYILLFFIIGVSLFFSKVRTIVNALLTSFYRKRKNLQVFGFAFCAFSAVGGILWLYQLYYDYKILRNCESEGQFTVLRGYPANLEYFDRGTLRSFTLEGTQFTRVPRENRVYDDIFRKFIKQDNYFVVYICSDPTEILKIQIATVRSQN